MFFIFYLQLWKEEGIEWPGKSSQEKRVGDKECCKYSEWVQTDCRSQEAD